MVEICVFQGKKKLLYSWESTFWAVDLPIPVIGLLYNYIWIKRWGLQLFQYRRCKNFHKIEGKVE